MAAHRHDWTRRALLVERAIESAVGNGLDLACEIEGMNLRISDIALREDLPKGTGIGTRSLLIILDGCDRAGFRTSITPSHGRSEALFSRLGFAWPAQERPCPVHPHLIMMVRTPRTWRPIR